MIFVNAPKYLNQVNCYYENGRVRAQLLWLKILLLEGRHVSAPLLGHHQVTKTILRGNYVGGRVTVRVILQRDLFVTFVTKMSRIIAKHLPIKVLNLMSTKIYKLQLTSIIHIYIKITFCVMNVQSLTKLLKPTPYNQKSLYNHSLILKLIINYVIDELNKK
jgi:hypothetical protein